MSDWTRQTIGGIECFILPAAPGLLVAMLTRNDGASPPPWDSLNLSYHVGDDPARVNENRARVCAALGLRSLVTVRQVHGAGIHEPGLEPGTPDAVEADALVTTRPGVGLGIKVADCLPVFAWDTGLSRVGIAHCGWKGTVAGLARLLAEEVARRAGTTAGRLRCALGPCICPACYPVGAEVIERVRQAFPGQEDLLVGLDGGRVAFDIRAANRRLLAGAGIEEAGSLDRCSFEQPADFYSARRDPVTGRNLAVIALR
ncbi:laccase domain-containing protein [candidate division WOR-3 bacterium]|nr:laccase domain-containing protein [candidate division WOR-3 bacterium]